MTDAKHPAQPTPLSLLERARSRDPHAWERLTTLYLPLVRYWCRQANCPASELDDLVQAVFAAVVTGLEGFRRDRPGDTFRGWLRGITRNQVFLLFRRSQGHPRQEGGSQAWERLQGFPDPQAGDTENEAEEIGQLYRRAVEQVRGEFEDRTWEMFWRTVIDGRSPSALAEELGVSPSAVRQAKSRVLRRLKQEMGELLE